MSYHSAQSSMSSSHSLFEPSLSSTFPMSHLASRTRLPFQSFPPQTTSSAASFAPTNVVAPAPASSSSSVVVGASGYPSTSLQFVERYAPYSAGPGPMDNNNGSRAMPYIAPTSFNPYRPNEVKHRKRTSRVQLKILEETFRTQTDKPDAALRQALSQRLNMPPRNVQIWFQNRRAKEKKLRAVDGTTSANEATSAATLSESTPAAAASPLSVSVSPTEVPSSENSAVQADGLNHVLSQFSLQSSSSSFVPSEFAPYKFDGLTQHRGSVPHIRTGLPTESLHQRSASSPTSLNSLNVPRPLTVQSVVQTTRSLPQSTSTYVFPPSMYQNPTTQPQLGEAFTFDASAQLTEDNRFLDATLQDRVGQVPFLADQGRTSSTESSQTVQAVGGGSANVLAAYHQSPPLHDLSPYSGTFSSSASPPSGLSSSSQTDLVNEYPYGYDTKYTFNGASKDSPAPLQTQGGYDFAAINNAETDMLAYRTYMLQHSDAPNYGMTGPAVAASNELQLGLESGLDMEYLYNTHSARNMGYGARTYNTNALGAF